MKQLWNKIMGLYHYTPKRIKILPANTDRESELITPFEKDKHYFDITVNEMFLSTKNNKNWLHTFDPMVFITTEFYYDGKPVAVPFVIGPSIGLSDKKQELPKDGGMIYKNIPVGGRNAYKGGSLAISLILSQFPYQSPLKKLLNIIESATSTYSKDIFPMVGNYLKIANILVDGMDALAESDDVKPLIGIRENYRDGDVKPGYFALVNLEDDKLDPEKFYVIDEELYYGETKNSAIPFRLNDYVLYSILKEGSRSDYESFPFFNTWKEIDTFVTNYPLSSDNKSVDIPKLEQEAKRMLYSLGHSMRFSPDLTGEQVTILYKLYQEKLDVLLGEKKTLSGKEDHFEEVKIADWEKEFNRINAEIFN
ncbi:MAG: hypothetical protein ABIM97_17415 [Ginsengibacter sp.]